MLKAYILTENSRMHGQEYSGLKIHGVFKSFELASIYRKNITHHLNVIAIRNNDAMYVCEWNQSVCTMYFEISEIELPEMKVMLK